MGLPEIRGTIERRILANYRVDPDAITRVLPEPFSPSLVDGQAMAGVCLIRLVGLRPRWVPAALGLRSESAAHRIAVNWEHEGKRHEGVYVPRRDTSSRLAACHCASSARRL